uniref:Uncharacterized protein LOC105053562 n=1 Tax=Elaeis guineensis var. tenera TaxID=51953 RepID=A0A6J0PP65_ELAGV
GWRAITECETSVNPQPRARDEFAAVGHQGGRSFFFAPGRGALFVDLGAHTEAGVTCGEGSLPSDEVLTNHSSEVLFVKFSNNGTCLHLPEMVQSSYGRWMRMIQCP